MKKLLLPMVAFAIVAVPFAMMSIFGLILNTTASVPLGLYRKVGAPIQRGSYVLFRLPTPVTAGRPYAEGQLIKKVAAMEGDVVSIERTGVTVNGARQPNSVPLPIDVNGRALPSLSIEHYRLGPGELLVMSSFNPRSFDSRYFGMVQQRSVLSVLVPVITSGTY